LVQPENNLRRLVIEVFVRNGKLIDPGVDTEGARDRPPTDETKGDKAAEPPKEAPAVDDAAATVPAMEDKVELAPQAPSSTTLYHRQALAVVALALSGAGRNWQRRMEQTLATAKPHEWRRLRTVGHRRRKRR
jgi:hypothetical protein